MINAANDRERAGSPRRILESIIGWFLVGAIVVTFMLIALMVETN